MKSGRLLGKQVVGSGGWRIGRVKDIIFDETTWRIEALEVRLDRKVAQEYRMKRLLLRTRLEVDVKSVHAIGDHVLLSVTKPGLRRMLSGGPESPPSEGGSDPIGKR
jgi:sporulation protein YlmC with PRC-barrel domain